MANSKRRRLNKNPQQRALESPNILKEALLATLDDPSLSIEPIKGRIIEIFERLSLAFQQSSGCGCSCGGPKSIHDTPQSVRSAQSDARNAQSVRPAQSVLDAFKIPPATNAASQVCNSGFNFAHPIADHPDAFNTNFRPWSVAANKAAKKPFIPPGLPKPYSAAVRKLSAAGTTVPRFSNYKPLCSLTVSNSSDPSNVTGTRKKIIFLSKKIAICASNL